jgi:uncharacterized protein
MKRLLLVGSFLLGVAAIVWHPSRPLYMSHRDVAIIVDDGIQLRGTISTPRWKRGPFPAMVLVHGSGPLTRAHLTGDRRQLVRLGFAVVAYDKRGAGASSGRYLPGATTPPDSLIRRMARDAAAVFDSFANDATVDTSRLGFFGASQAGWIIPLAAELTQQRPRFQVVLSGSAVSTGIEQLYSELTGDGTGAPLVTDQKEIERRLSAFTGPAGFDPALLLRRSLVPTLWLLGDRDESGPTFATVRTLDSLRAVGADRNDVIVYPNTNHALRDVRTGAPAPVWRDMMTWLVRIQAIAGLD